MGYFAYKNPAFFIKRRTRQNHLPALRHGKTKSPFHPRETVKQIFTFYHSQPYRTSIVRISPGDYGKNPENSRIVQILAETDDMVLEELRIMTDDVISTPIPGSVLKLIHFDLFVPEFAALQIKGTPGPYFLIMAPPHKKEYR